MAREIDMVSSNLGKRRTISQLHWGGGTPTNLTDKQTNSVFEMLTDKFTLQDKAEISIELDPRITTIERIELLKALGFNRLSFGVQDFNSEIQKAIGRNQDEKRTSALYRQCREIGFDSINFDLIYGLPGQNIKNFSQSIEKTIKLGPDRIALYSFAYLPNALPHQQKIKNNNLPDAELKFDLFFQALKLFIEAGYIQIGMDHFVLPDDELAKAVASRKLRRNFMGYTINAAKDWIGIGMSAIGYIDKSFVQNISSVDKYIAAIENNHLATYRGIRLSKDDLIRQDVISNLMCNFILDFKEIESNHDIKFKSYFKDELESLEEFKNDKIITTSHDGIKIEPNGRIFVRNIAMIFDSYLKDDGKKPKVQYSRTI
jgi:oxygen-independent coproporphyrinogen-3 oxidase